MPSEEIKKSTYVDFTGYGNVPDGTTVEDAYDMQGNFQPATNAHINVAIVLGRANATSDPNVSLLSEPWAKRQAAIADQDKIWKEYGADQDNYTTVYDALLNDGLTILNNTNSNYVTSQELRTIWVELDEASDFNNLFGTTLQQFEGSEDYGSFVFWQGNLSLPKEWKVAGLWFDTGNAPRALQQTAAHSVTLSQGPQSIGNGTALTYPVTADYSAPPTIAPQKIAELYNFPLNGKDVATGLMSFIEPGAGTYLPSDPMGSTFQALLDQYLAGIKRSGTGSVASQGINGQTDASGERSLDVGIAAAINPNSDIVLYTGSGSNQSGDNGMPSTGFARSSTFTAYQSSIWDTINNPVVSSSSWGSDNAVTPGSPFYTAFKQLYIDAALRNQTIFIAAGDGGSGYEIGNGLTNVKDTSTQPYNILVGGSSLSTLNSAQADPTLSASLVSAAMAGDPATIWGLVSGGLRSLPTNAATTQYFVEAVWNIYYLNGNNLGQEPGLIFEGGYYVNSAGAGGVDPTQPVPSYQIDYGLNPVTSDPLQQVGRGVPDVAANAGGNLQYLVPTADMQGTEPDGGTSAATPLWAALGLQLNEIFSDQHLPNLGYMNDLLYIASAVAPGSFNDISLGNNISSFFAGGSYETLYSNSVGDVPITPTGYGYFAGPGYDLATGLGSPNGVLLARALTQIAHSQTYFSHSHDLLDQSDSGGWTSGANQSLLFQAMSASAANVSINNGMISTAFSSTGGSSFAWTNQLAQQSLQSDFDPGLVLLFDKYGQGTVAQSYFSVGDELSIGINGAPTTAIQGTLSSPFGFADFLNNNGDVRVARSVAVAETAGGLSDVSVVVRARQGGQDNDSVTFYKVDNLAGTIKGVQPGQEGYAALARDRAYQLESGGIALNGPGYGNYTQTELLHVGAGDKIAMYLSDNTSGITFWAFSQANEQMNGQSVGHIWSYGLNTWGWEDMKGGGDHDYQDMTVQLDFTSHYGHDLLV